MTKVYQHPTAGQIIIGASKGASRRVPKPAGIAPGAAGTIPDQVITQGGGPATVALATYFTGTALTFALQAPVTGVSLAGSTLTISDTSVLASASVTVVASNAFGPSATQSFSRTVNAPAAGGSISVTEWPRDRFAFDSGAWRGENNADIPVRITASAGEVIQARLVPTDGGAASAWTDVGTANGAANQLVGHLSSRKRSSPCLLQVRLKAAPATTAITGYSITIGHVVAIWGQSEHAQWQTPGTAGTPPTPETLSIKHAVMALKSRWASGRRSTAALKVPGVDALPAGMSRAGTDITITGTILLLNNWDFTGFKASVGAGGYVELASDCVFGERTGLANIDTYLFANVGGTVRQVEYCDVTGWDGFPNDAYGGNALGAPKAFRAEITGSGANIQTGNIVTVRRCRFTNLPSDAIKITGCQSEPQVVEWNYFGPAVAYGNDRAAYDPGRTYVLGECADNGGETYILKVASSLGVAPPAGLTSGNANWAWTDPHSDTMQFPAAKNGAIIRFNYIEQIETPRNRGINSSIYLARDANNNDRLFDKVHVEWNYMPFTLGSFGAAIRTSNGSGTNIVTPTIRNNWIGRRASGANPYLKTDNSLAFEWGGNVGLDTGSLITAASLTNAIDVAALPEYADGRITHLWQDRSLGSGAAGIRTRVSTNATPYTSALAAITNAVLSVVGDDFVTFVHHTVSGTDWPDVLNDITANRGWSNDEALHLHATGNGLSRVGAVYASWYAAPSTYKDDYGKVWAAAFLGRNTDGSAVTTPVTVTYGVGGGSQVTFQRTLAQLYDWTYTRAILPDAHQFAISPNSTPIAWSEGANINTGIPSNLRDKRRSSTSVRIMQALPAMQPYFTMRPFAPNGYHTGFPATAGSHDPAGASHMDEAHPNRYEDRGQNTFARMSAYAILQAANLLPIPVPEFDQVTLMTDASVLRVGSSAGPIITSRTKHAEASISDTSATDHHTDVMGFEYSGAPVHQALLKPDGKVYVYPRGGTLPTSGPTIPNGAFTPGSTGMTFGMGGATGGLVHPSDNLADLERNYPLVDFGLLGIDGVPVRAIPTALQGAHPTGSFTVP
ncbi:hypothetical protein [Albidovulum sp.]|uniref:hypothetical protein n=1 Tax=Albidovulum sp. TaxID=1872424 RepID=UPI0039B855F4